MLRFIIGCGAALKSTNGRAGLRELSGCVNRRYYHVLILIAVPLRPPLRSIFNISHSLPHYESWPLYSLYAPFGIKLSLPLSRFPCGRWLFSIVSPKHRCFKPLIP